MTRQTLHSSTSEPSGQRRRFEPSIRISVGRRRTRAGLEFRDDIEMNKFLCLLLTKILNFVMSEKAEKARL